MQNAINEISELLSQDNFEKCTFSSPSNKSGELRSVIINSVKNYLEIKVEIRLQKHNNIRTVLKKDFIRQDLAEYLKQFKQCLIKTETTESQILLNKKLQSTIIRKSFKKIETNKDHNRQKNYLIPDGKINPFLIAIDIMDKTGKVRSTHYSKFRQINRFLELVDDLYQSQNIEQLHVVDFGCGKSYLTFALYFYFESIKQIKIKITGIDLKQEVIDHCNAIAADLGYEHLHFAHGFIHKFETTEPVDFVVTLHACDTATDDAILFSLRNNAKQMMFVPCCQHELNKQLDNKDSSILLKHGIFRDRLTALITDTMRSQLIEVCGYKVQSMEFISLEHTSKNILLRCTQVERDKKQTNELLNKYFDFKKQWNISPYLENQLVLEKFLVLVGNWQT